MMTSHISFCFYVKKTATGYPDDRLLVESQNIVNHIKNFTKVARENQQEPPQFFIHLLLFDYEKKVAQGTLELSPEWEQFETLLEKHITQKVGDTGAQVYIQEFIMTPLEHKYLCQLNSEIKNRNPSSEANGGNIIDLMKINILKRTAKNTDHLQLDTNTVIRNYAKLYQLTFINQTPQFFINVYASKRVYTVNNKIIFLPSGHRLFQILDEMYEEHLTNFLFSIDNLKNSSSLSHDLIIYNDLFLKALKEAGVLNQNGFINYGIDNQTNLPNPDISNQFAITSTIVGRVLQTWKNGQKNQVSLSIQEDTSNLANSHIPIDSDSEPTIQLDFPGFMGYMRKHSTVLTGPPLSSPAAQEKYLEQHYQLFPLYSDDRECADIIKFIHEHLSQKEVFSKIINKLVKNAGKNTSHAIVTKKLKDRLDDVLNQKSEMEQASPSMSLEQQRGDPLLNEHSTSLEGQTSEKSTPRAIHHPRFGHLFPSPVEKGVMKDGFCENKSGLVQNSRAQGLFGKSTQPASPTNCSIQNPKTKDSFGLNDSPTNFDKRKPSEELPPQNSRARGLLDPIKAYESPTFREQGKDSEASKAQVGSWRKNIK